MEGEQLFFELRSEIFRRQLSNSENFDKAILTYASGSLALSLTFLKDFVPLDQASYAGILYCSWILFAFCIAVTVASYRVSNVAHERQLKIAEEYYRSGDHRVLMQKNQPAIWTDRLNWISGGAFCVAVFLTTAFVAVNAKEASMIRERKDHPGSFNSERAKGIGIEERRAVGVPGIVRIPSVTPPVIPEPKPGPEQPQSESPSGGQQPGK